MRVLLPWLCTCVASVIAVVGWTRVEDLQQKLQKTTSDVSVIQQKKEWIEWTETFNEKEGSSQKKGQKLSINPEQSSINHAVTVISQEELQSCLNDPQVQQVISNKVQKISEGIATKRVKEELEKKRDQHLEKIYDRYDEGEDHFTNAVNAYTEEYQLEESVSIKLQQIVEDGFNAQRDILARFQAEELSEEEAKQLGREAHEADKLAVRDLLGEEGAKLFGEVIRAEYSEQ